MLTSTMKTDRHEARNLMGVVAYNCCAAKTPAGSVYQRLVQYLDQPQRAGQPNSWQTRVENSSANWSQAFVKKGFSFAAPLFYLYGSGMPLRDVKDWQCGAVSLMMVAAVDLLTRPFGRRTSIHILAASLLVSWPFREGVRLAGLAGVLALGASGGLLGAAVGSVEHLKILAAGPVKMDDVTSAVRHAYGEVVPTLHDVNFAENRAIALLEEKIKRRLNEDEVDLVKKTLCAWSLEQTAADHAMHVAISERRNQRLRAESQKVRPGEDPVFGANIRF